MPPGDPVRVDNRNHFEHEIVPQVCSLEAVRPQQLLHEPNKRPLPRHFARVHPCTDQTLLFIFEHPWLIITHIAWLCVEVFFFVVDEFAGCYSDAFYITTFLTFAESHSVEIDGLMIFLLFV